MTNDDSDARINQEIEKLRSEISSIMNAEFDKPPGFIWAIIKVLFAALRGRRVDIIHYDYKKKRWELIYRD